MPFTDPYVANPYPYAFAATLSSTTNPGAPYEIVENFVSGVYTISWSGGGTLNVDFYNGTTFIGNATGTSSITYNLAQSATKAVLWNTVANVSVVISLTALTIAPVSGVLTTYTASGTPGLVGDAYCVLVGGGAAGQGGTGNVARSGGGSGGIISFRVTLAGNEALVIGQGGIGGSPGGKPGQASTFAGQTAGGGTNTGSFGGAGSPNGGNGGYQPNLPTASSAASYLFPFFAQGTTGGGAGTIAQSSNPSGAGSGIGTGGSGAGTTGGGGNGGDAIGFGAGGGGGWLGAGTATGGNGAPGVLYVILVA